MHTQSYFPSRSKLSMFLLGAILFSIVGIWELLPSGDPPSLYVRIAIWVAVPFSVYVSFYLITRLMGAKPSVVLNEYGLYDNASIVSAGLIRWYDIASIVVYSVNNRKMVGVLLKDNDKFVAQFGPIRRVMYRIILSLGFPIVAIPESTVSVKAEYLAEQISQFTSAHEP